MRKIYGLLVGRSMNFSFIDDYLCASARPMSKKEVDWLAKSKGVKAILSLTETPIPSAWLANIPEYKHVAIRNHTAPSVSQLNECVDFILKNTKKQRITDVHCAAGKGRTGTVLAAYLCASQHLSAEDAIRVVRAKRNGSVEKNSGQEESVSELSAFLKERAETKQEK